MKQERITVSDVRKSFNRNIKNHFTVKWFGRPVANYLTPLFYNLGWSANQVTAFRSVLAAFGLIVLLGPSPYWPVAAGIFYLCFILDCVDGNMARLHDTTTYWGKFIDGLADGVFVYGAPFAAGAGVWLTGGRAEWMMLGMFVTTAALTTQMVRNRLSFFREWMVGMTGPVDEEVLTQIKRPQAFEKVCAIIIVNGTFFAPLLLLAPAGREWSLATLVPAQLLPDLVWFVVLLWTGRLLLSRGRKSIHAPPNKSCASGSPSRK